MPRKIAAKPAEVLDALSDGATGEANDATPAEDDAPATASPTKATTREPFATLDEVPEYLRVVYWGLEGSGKTTAALMATALGKVLVINIEGGLKKKPLRDQGVDTSQVEVWPNPKDPVKITHKSLDALFRRLKAAFRDDPNAYAAVVIDSGGETVNLIRDDVSADRIRKDLITDAYDKFFTDRSDYGTASKMMRDLLRKFRDLPCHLIVTALQRRDEDEDTKKVTYGPDVNPAVQNDILGQFDIVLRCSAGTDEKPFRALSHGITRYRTKDRFGALPKVLAEPSFVRVLAYVEEDLDEATDELQTTLSTKKDEETEKTGEN